MKSGFSVTLKKIYGKMQKNGGKSLCGRTSIILRLLKLMSSKLDTDIDFILKKINKKNTCTPGLKSKCSKKSRVASSQLRSRLSPLLLTRKNSDAAT